MSCQQNQQQCQPPPKCPSPKCPKKSPAQFLPAASCSAPCSGGCGGLSSIPEGGCCLSHHRHRRPHVCNLRSSDSCDVWDSGCGHSSGGCC
uniref:Uncharacterized protein n=1 Tax=Cavia porcellus TaxID=10141 RepID=A0A286Y580_CAVPO